MMEDIYCAVIFIIFILGIGAMIFYMLITKSTENKRMKREIMRKFKAEEKDGSLYFKYRDYDIIITFKPKVRVSILHNKDVENIKAPKGAKLTPLYLIFPIKKAGEIGEKLDEYIEFLESIPTR